MANTDQYVAAAKVLPANRTVAEQALVDAGQGIQEVRNADHADHAHQRVYGA